MSSTKALLTTGAIARRLNIPVHRVEHLIQSRRIDPVSRAGNLRIFDEQAFQCIENLVGRGKGDE
jgi:hypothetical protein